MTIPKLRNSVPANVLVSTRSATPRVFCALTVLLLLLFVLPVFGQQAPSQVQAEAQRLRQSLKDKPVSNSGSPIFLGALCNPTNSRIASSLSNFGLLGATLPLHPGLARRVEAKVWRQACHSGPRGRIARGSNTVRCPLPPSRAARGHHGSQNSRSLRQYHLCAYAVSL